MIAGAVDFANPAGPAASPELRGNVLRIEADQDKTYQTRDIPLPEDIAQEVHSVEGEEYLWGSYCRGARVHRKGRRNADQFTPSLMCNFVKWVFEEYQKAHPDKRVKSHDLRKRAVTLMALSTQSVDLMAAALGVTPQTARNHYLETRRAFNGAELLKEMVGVVRPQKPPQYSDPKK